MILYELFHWFKTDMEKYKCLELLRHGEIDTQTKQHWHAQVLQNSFQIAIQKCIECNSGIMSIQSVHF